MQHRRQSLRPIWVNHKNKACILCTHTRHIFALRTHHTQNTQKHTCTLRGAQRHTSKSSTLSFQCYISAQHHISKDFSPSELCISFVIFAIFELAQCLVLTLALWLDRAERMHAHLRENVHLAACMLRWELVCTCGGVLVHACICVSASAQSRLLWSLFTKPKPCWEHWDGNLWHHWHLACKHWQ